MSNRIGRVTVVQKRISPVEAELWVVVEADRVDAGTELRGRLVGPKCPGIETVQVPYPLRPIPQATGLPANTVAGRVLVPEPNLWTPETPFTYEAVVELVQDGRRCDATSQEVALKKA